jgi:ubiquinone/menaquinone biosynthesis C-methylase UbiE
MMERVLEVEVMDTPEEAADYDTMDHSEVNAAFCDDLLAFAGAPTVSPTPRWVDFGTGTALIPIALCTRAQGFNVVAIDLAEHMLHRARKNVEHAALGSRITLELADGKRTRFDDETFDVTFSNSIIHHIPEPRIAFEEMWRVTKRGGVLFVRDLLRPESMREVDSLVARYAGTPPEDPAAKASFDHQRALLQASLCASLTLVELGETTRSMGFSASSFTKTSDRHWTLAMRKP